MAIKGIARKGDREASHCSTPFRKGHFRTVFADGKPVSGDGHLNTNHTKPCKTGCCGHSAPLKATQSTVFAEGIRVGRVGDPTCTKVVQGSTTVFVGGAFNQFSDVYGGDLSSTEGSF
jgi:hypothetical protein